MAMTDNLVANLKIECTRQHLSQAELARRSGLHFTTVNKIFQKKMNPTLDLCEKLAIALGLERPEKLFRQPA